MKNSLLTAVSAAAVLLSISASTATAQSGGWYFSVFGGANFLEDTDFGIAGGTITNDYDTGFLVGGAVGYDFGAITGGPFGVRVEGELSFRENDIDEHSINGAPGVPGSDGDTSAFAGMVNLLLDFDVTSGFSIYGGGGIGAANVDFDDHSIPGLVAMNDDDTRFAYQLIGGIGYEISPNWVVDVQYRYFRVDNVDLTSTVATGAVGSSTDYESHSVLGGIRWRF